MATEYTPDLAGDFDTLLLDRQVARHADLADDKISVAGGGTVGERIANMPLSIKDAPFYAVGNGVTVDSEALALGFAAMEVQGRPLKITAGRYVIDRDFRLPGNGNRIIFEGNPVFIQKTLGMGFLQLVGHDGALVGAFDVIYEGERSQISGNFYGYGKFQRMCAVWLEGSRWSIDDVGADNMMVALCMRGPVARRDTAPDATPLPDDGQSLIDYRPQADGNWIKRVRGNRCDLTLSGNHQRDGGVLEVISSNITKKQNIPPHDIYMRTNAETTADNGVNYSGKCTRFTIGRCEAVGNLFSQAFKIRNMELCSIGPLIADNCAGGFLGTYLTDVVVSLGAITNMREQNVGTPEPEDDGASYAAEVIYSTRVTVRGSIATGAPGQRIGGARARLGSTAIVFDGVRLSESQEGEGPITPFRGQDASEVEFVSCERHRSGAADKEMFVASDTSKILARAPRMTGSALLANAAEGASIDIEVNSVRVAGMTGSYFTGTKAAIAVNDNRVKDFTFVPTLVDSVAGTQPAAYTTQMGRCIRRGGMVRLEIRITLNGAHGISGTSNLDIANLPYTPRSSGSPPRYFAPVLTDNVTMTAGQRLIAQASASGVKTIRLQNWADQTRSNSSASQLAANARLDFVLEYPTDDPF